MPPCSAGRLKRYGDLMVRSPAGWRNRAARPEGDIAWMADVCDTRLEFWMTQRARNDVTAA
jgi:hypothetical protein